MLMKRISSGSGSFLSSLLRESMTKALRPCMLNERGDPMLLDDVSIAVICATSLESGDNNNDAKQHRLGVHEGVFEEVKLEAEFKRLAKETLASQLPQ